MPLELTRGQRRWLKKNKDMTGKEIRQLVKEFNEMDKSGDGVIRWIEYRDFKEAQGVPKPEYVKAWRAFGGADGDGLQFSELLKMEEAEGDSDSD